MADRMIIVRTGHAMWLLKPPPAAEIFQIHQYVATALFLVTGRVPQVTGLITSRLEKRPAI